MTLCTDQCFEMNSDNIKSKDINFFKELYAIMKKYNIHRIYTASLDKKQLVVAQQLLSTNIANTKFTKKLFEFVDRHYPWLYFNIFFKNHIYRYKLKVKRLFNKYKIEAIKATSFNLYQGIYITNNSLCVREIDLVLKEGQIFHIENLYLDI